jgi:hypothetical protein
MPLFESTSQEKVIGDGQQAALESFEGCIHSDDEYDSESKDGYKGIYHRCRYADMYGRCIYDNCVFDQNEGPKIAHKHWVKCIVCDAEISLDPKLIDVPICDKCRAIFLQCCKLPFTCQICGESQSSPSKVYFSRICDECWDKIINNGCMTECLYYAPQTQVMGDEYDLP